MTKDLITNSGTDRGSGGFLGKLRGKKSLFLYLLAFLIPLCGIIACAWVRRLAPFGGRSLMAMDASAQYFPMLRGAERAFLQFGGDYSFAEALGFNLTAQNAYYTASPLWWPVFLLPGELTVTQVHITVFLRFALAGLTFFVYLCEHFERKNISMLAFSTAYAFSGYTIAYINQFMWMDAVVLLPLVLLGVERIFKRKGVLLYTVSLFLTIFSNFYIAYAVCLFTVLWYLVTAVLHPCPLKERGRRFSRFALCSLLAGGLNLGMLLPLLRALSKTAASGKGYGGEIMMYHSPLETLQKLLPLGRSSHEFESANIYFGILCAGLLLLAVFLKIPLKKKIVYGSLLLFLLFSFEFSLLDYIWHGFHYPNQLPARQSFVFIFTALVCSCGGLLVFLDGHVKKEKMRKILVAALCLVMLGETGLHTAYMFLRDVKTMAVSKVSPLDAVMETVREEFAPDTDNSEFWRMEMAQPRFNDGLLYGYFGITSYSSTMSKECYTFFKQLGMDVYAKNVSTRYIPNPVANALFGVRYILSSEAEADEVSTLAATIGDMYVFENEAVLPLFYVADESVMDVDMNLQGFLFADDLFRKAAGCESVIAPSAAEEQAYILNESEFMKGIGNLRASETEITSFSSDRICGTVRAEKDGILLISLPAADVKIEIDGTEAETLTVAGYMAGAYIEEGMHEILITLP